MTKAVDYCIKPNPDGADHVSSATCSLLYSEHLLSRAGAPALGVQIAMDEDGETAAMAMSTRVSFAAIGSDCRVLSNAWPRLLVNDANVICCYPFAVPKADPVALVASAKLCRDEAERKGVALEFAGRHPAIVEDLELSETCGRVRLL